MMDEDATVYMVVIVAVLVLLAAIFGVSKWSESVSCSSRWEDSRHAVRWGLMSGCQIQLADGSWVPSSAYREVAP